MFVNFDGFIFRISDFEQAHLEIETPDKIYLRLYTEYGEWVSCHSSLAEAQKAFMDLSKDEYTSILIVGSYICNSDKLRCLTLCKDRIIGIFYRHNPHTEDGISCRHDIFNSFRWFQIDAAPGINTLNPDYINDVMKSLNGGYE